MGALMTIQELASALLANKAQIDKSLNIPEFAQSDHHAYRILNHRIIFIDAKLEFPPDKWEYLGKTCDGRIVGVKELALIEKRKDSYINGHNKAIEGNK